MSELKCQALCVETFGCKEFFFGKTGTTKEAVCQLAKEGCNQESGDYDRFKVMKVDVVDKPDYCSWKPQHSRDAGPQKCFGEEYL